MNVPMKPPILTPLILAAALAAGSADDAASAARCQDVLRYLKADSSKRDGVVARWGATGPVVRLAGGSPAIARSDAEYAIWLINKELPENWQLRVGKTPVAREDEYDFDMIKIVYRPREEWPVSGDYGVGHTKPRVRDDGKMVAARVLIDHTRLTEERLRILILLHELLHALGRWHVDHDEFPETIMHASSPSWTPPALKSLDKAALRAVYSPLVPVGASVLIEKFIILCSSVVLEG